MARSRLRTSHCVFKYGRLLVRTKSFFDQTLITRRLLGAEKRERMELKRMLVHFCKKKDWSLARLARESGVPKPTLHGWTTGRSALNLDQLKKVCSALEVSLHELVFGVPDPYEAPMDEVLRELFTGDVRVSIHRIERKEKGR